VGFVFYAPSSAKYCYAVVLESHADRGWEHIARATVKLTREIGLIQVFVGHGENALGTWRVRDVRVEQYTPLIPARILQSANYVHNRVSMFWRSLVSGSVMRERSVEVRFRETSAVLGQVARASFPRKVAGHGLGARYEFATTGIDVLGNEEQVKDPNFIHNFFAFLLFKLGIGGTFLVMTSLVLWITWGIRALACRHSDDVAVLASAAVAIWVAYSAWGLFCPQFIDFNDAPLFGVLLGCLAGIQGAKLAASPSVR
jgi:hypothetical protein